MPGWLLDVVGVSHLGRRAEQQDAFRIRELPADGAWLVVLADGMGGAAAGAVASRIAVDGFVASFVAAREAGQDVGNSFKTALAEVNERIAGVQEASPETLGMGTTLVGVYLSRESLSWISIGDSPLWRFRDRALHRLNEDHSLRELAKPTNRVNANTLTSALTGGELSIVDGPRSAEPLINGDCLMLASDGLLTLPEPRLAEELHKSGKVQPKAIADAILQAVVDAGLPNQDNCTLVIAAPGKKSRFRLGLFAIMAIATIGLVAMGALAYQLVG